jgi:hypothetical protein
MLADLVGHLSLSFSFFFSFSPSLFLVGVVKPIWEILIFLFFSSPLLGYVGLS